MYPTNELSDFYVHASASLFTFTRLSSIYLRWILLYSISYVQVLRKCVNSDELNPLA